MAAPVFHAFWGICGSKPLSPGVLRCSAARRSGALSCTPERLLSRLDDPAADAPPSDHMRTRRRDPARRSAGEYARASVRRLRLRTIAALGVLAVATAGLGRAFGLGSVLFLVSEVALLVAMFVILHFVVPLLERRDRGARGEEHVGALLDELAEGG